MSLRIKKRLIAVALSLEEVLNDPTRARVTSSRCALIILSISSLTWFRFPKKWFIYLSQNQHDLKT